MPRSTEYLPQPDLELIRLFLRERGWRLEKPGSKFDLYYAPNSIGTNVELTIPAQTSEKPRSRDLLLRTAGILAEIHDISFEQLAIVLSVPDTVASIQLDGTEMRNGTIPLVMFDGIVDRLRKALLHGAAFTITDEPVIARTPGRAQEYLRACRFLQTEVGSFIANVQMPATMRLAEPDLFRETPVESGEVEHRIAELLDFVTSAVIPGKDDLFTEDSLLSASSVLNLDLLRDVGDLYCRTDADRVNVSFLSARGHRVIKSGVLTQDSQRRIDQYISYARENLAGEFHIDVTGRVVELHARRKDRKRNFVGVSATHRGREVFIALGVRAADYPEAIRAHAENKWFRVAGMVKRMRTQLRVTKLDYFEVLDHRDSKT